MKKRILLTGAAGNIGYEALKQLLEHKDKYEISVFDLKTPKSQKRFEQHQGDIHIFYGDLTDPSASIEATKNQDYVIHFAAIIPPAAYQSKELTLRINTEGSKHLIRNLEQYSPNAFFVFSSSVAT